MLLDIFFLIAGIFLLIKGSDIFIDAGSAIAKVFRINEILLGLTFVSFGTSLPELLIGINSATSGSHGIAIGNIIGTNIFNIAVILGIICIIRPVKFLRGTVKKDMYMSLLTSIVIFVLLLDTYANGAMQNMISRTDGIIMLLLFGIFMYYTLYSLIEEINARKEHRKARVNHNTNLDNVIPINEDVAKSEIKEKEKEEVKEIKITLKDIDKITKNFFLMILGLAMIFFGSEFVVDSAKDISIALNLSEAFIAIVVIAVGTSLPEISTSIVAFKKGKGNIAIGNLIGSNMFNTLFVLGTAATISPIILPMDSLLIDCIFFILVCLVISVFSRAKFELSRKEGILLVAIYILYLVFVINRL